MAADVPEYHRSRRERRNGGTAWPESGRDHVLVVTRGHPFDRNAFFAVFEANAEIEWSHAEHPAAQLLFAPEAAERFDCFVLYDMPGINFRAGEAPTFFDPPEDYKRSLRALLDKGHPLVILHHGCAAWPTWPEWSEIVGSHFLYQPGESRGEVMPDSGYVLDVAHTVTPVADHPITKGVEPFTLVDELYLAPVFEDSVTPLFVSDFEFVDSNFSSADLAVRGELNARGDWTHPPGSNLVGWVKSAGKSPIVYLQFGDGPSTYNDPNYRRILANAIRWACSEEAAAWAQAN
jgi:type 1 glutamine amidotransferase